jgi:hypothetical protein
MVIIRCLGYAILHSLNAHHARPHVTLLPFHLLILIDIRDEQIKSDAVPETITPSVPARQVP